MCREISVSKEFPVRISITEIIKRVGHKVWIDKRHKKLPNTTQVINKYLETLEDFMLRKIKWTTEQFIKRNTVPRLNHFKVKAVVRNGTSDNSQTIQRAIESALVEIQRSV